ncbi:VQ domain-containing protein [Cephalotus follicularis]|uniref:VQ domain-containing protein n=1 Tax=Cephalotus follicularis TaxID=3775 RepID=A0A1Q3CDF1_CEPFO|nr:VQ domain-containing protein [Cephalotus follicularis]
MNHPPTYGSDPTSPNTTFVQADPSTFRTIVQKLTGAPDDPSTQKLPLTLPTRPASKPGPATPDIGPKRSSFKLHERRQSAKKLEIKLNNNNYNKNMINHYHGYYNYNNINISSNAECPEVCFVRQRGFLVSPVSTLDFMVRVSATSPYEARVESPMSPCEEEEKKAIAEKGFYLHPSPRASEPPELLPLFPLHSP